MTSAPPLGFGVLAGMSDPVLLVLGLALDGIGAWWMSRLRLRLCRPPEHP